MPTIKCVKCQNVIADYYENSGLYGVRTKNLLSKDFIKDAHQKVFVDLPVALYCKYEPLYPIAVELGVDGLVNCPRCKRLLGKKMISDKVARIKIDVDFVNKFEVKQKKRMECNQCGEQYDLNASGDVKRLDVNIREINIDDIEY